MEFEFIKLNPLKTFRSRTSKECRAYSNSDPSKHELNIPKNCWYIEVCGTKVQYSLDEKWSNSGGSKYGQFFLKSNQVDQIEARVYSSRETRRMAYLEFDPEGLSA